MPSDLKTKDKTQLVQKEELNRDTERDPIRVEAE